MSPESLVSSPSRFSGRSQHLRGSAIREILKVTDAADVISFAGGLPAPELFPVDDVLRAVQSVLIADGAAAFQYSATEGYALLRAWVAAHVAKTVQVAADAGRVLITHGSQQGLDLVAKVLLNPGDVVLVENPAYLGALQAFRAYEAQVVGVPADEHGLRADALRTAIATARRRPKFLYVIPNFQNPTGLSMAASRRVEIAALAAEHDLLVVEDDPYGQLRFSGTGAPAVVARAGRDWIYLGTTSKILAPGLRVAWLISGDAALHEKLVIAKQAADLHTATFTQRLVAEMLRAPGWLEAHVARLRSVYARRRDVMLESLARGLPATCTWTRPEGGLFLWVTLPQEIDATELLRAAMRERVAFVPGEPFWVGEPQRNTLRLNFSNASEARIAEGIARLAGVM